MQKIEHRELRHENTARTTTEGMKLGIDIQAPKSSFSLSFRVDRRVSFSRHDVVSFRRRENPRALMHVVGKRIYTDVGCTHSRFRRHGRSFSLSFSRFSFLSLLMRSSVSTHHRYLMSRRILFLFYERTHAVTHTPNVTPA